MSQIYTFNPEPLNMQRTRYGAYAKDLTAASTPLRNQAASEGAVLQDATESDLASAIVGADAWCAFLGANSLEHINGWGNDAMKVMAAVLARASGNPSGLVAVPIEDCTSSVGLMLLGEQHAQWLEQLGVKQVGKALFNAGSDLYAAGSGNLFAAYGFLLQMMSEEY